MSGANIITRVDVGNTAFQRAWKKLKPDIAKHARAAVGALLLVDVENPPSKLHLHPLTSKTVPSVLDPSKKVKVYTFHVTPDDTHKASFTLENGTAYMRVLDTHDAVDRNP